MVSLQLSARKTNSKARKRRRVQRQHPVSKQQQPNDGHEEPVQHEDEETTSLYDAAQSQLLEEMAAAGLEGSLPMSFGSNKQSGRPVSINRRKRKRAVDEDENEGDPRVYSSHSSTSVALSITASSPITPAEPIQMEKVHVKYDSDGEVTERVVEKVEPLVVPEEAGEEEYADAAATDDGEIEAPVNPDGAQNGEHAERTLRYGNASSEQQQEQTSPPVDETVFRFWKRRNQLFYKYDEGILLDHESWYSVTPQAIAEHIAQRLSKCDVVVDPFAGCGGNVIQLAMQCKHVIAIDIDPEKVRMAQHNAAIYGVAHKIEWIVGNSLDILPTLKADAVFLSPPWGGLDYSREHFRLDEMLIKGASGTDLFAKARQVTRNIAYYVPKTTPNEELEALAPREELVECEKIFLNKHLTVVTAYYGDLAKQPDKKKSKDKKKADGDTADIVVVVDDGDSGALEQQDAAHSNGTGCDEEGQQIETVVDQPEADEPSSDTL